MHIPIKRRYGNKTRINQVDIDPRLRERISSGVDFVDEALGQGFVPSTVTMLTGDPGCGKTTLALQIAAQMSALGHSVLFNSAEQAPACVAINVERMGLMGSPFYIGQDVMTDKLLQHANEIASTTPADKKVVIIQDSLPTLMDPRSTLSNMWANGKSPEHNAELFCGWAQETYGIVVFINHVTKGGGFAGKQGLLHTVDAHARLWFDTKVKSPTFGERLFQVGKNRWGSSGVTSLVAMTADHGLVQKGKLVDYVPDET